VWWNDDMHATQVAQDIVTESDIRPGQGKSKLLFRALHNMRCVYTHWTYCGDRIYDNGEKETVWYWGKPDLKVACAAADLTSYLEVEHRHSHRSQRRMLDSYTYYNRRDEELVERLPGNPAEVA